MKLNQFLCTSFFAALTLIPVFNASAVFENKKIMIKTTKTYQEPWGMGGCGFGSLILKDKTQGAQMGASILNMISGMTQTFAMSSGTSNCVTNNASLAANEQSLFISVNLSSLSKEAAQGDGEHIVALAEVFGCPHEEFAKMSQSHYKDIYGSNEPAEVLQNYRKEVSADKHLAHTCSRAS